ncbi:MAG: hypothetical protein K6G87_13625 [Butyrivibrio sp.]|uniref:flagellar hook capping FlgD N-terminal domain-containing protein n=1 Tax=Butyrivibrio sp. TaxID=28121 RepID=UPI0025F05838|nr:flagellar hook capping FlgD N-terminal domain-containing protein [Butyrivibrio sp.]MCR5772256.1 hypothetical protein [Butyrivibrio sp.]
MAVDAIVKDGVIVNNGKAASETTETTSNDKLGEYKEQFMQLLCAQMKYQDPLEPTSNTEYISQYAQFTQVEQMQNMAQNMALNRASDMVGKTVQITEVDESTGETTSVVEGVVDYVSYSNGDAYVSVNGSKYSLDDVTAVVDSTYYSDTKLVDTVNELLEELPGVDYVTLYSDQSNLEKMLSAYESISGDVSSYFTTTELSKISQYALKYAELVEKASQTSEESTDTTSTTEVEET